MGQHSPSSKGRARARGQSQWKAALSAPSDNQGVESAPAASVATVRGVFHELATRPSLARRAVKDELVPFGNDGWHAEGHRGCPVAAVSPRLGPVGVRAPETAEVVIRRPGRRTRFVDGCPLTVLSDEVHPHTEMKAPAVEATVTPGGHSLTGLHTRLPNRHAVVGKRRRRHDQRQQSNHNHALQPHLDARTISASKEVPPQRLQRGLGQSRTLVVRLW